MWASRGVDIASVAMRPDYWIDLVNCNVESASCGVIQALQESFARRIPGVIQRLANALSACVP